MPNAPRYTIADLAAACGGRFLGAAEAAARPIRTVATLKDATPDDVTWIADAKHAKELASTSAAAVIGDESILKSDPRAILVKDASLAAAIALDLFWTPPSAPEPGVHPSAVVDKAAKLADRVAVGVPLAVIGPGCNIGEGTIIHEGVSIGADVTIGRDTILFDRSVVYDRCKLGDRVIIHAGAIIGTDGFGYIFREGRHRRIAHIGTVTIEDDVEIGANSCVDRAKVGSTVIGRGSKIDNLVMVAHNVQVGPLCILAAQVGISGSARLGTGVVMGGQVGVVDGVVIGDGAKFAAQSGVIGDVPPGITVFGTPARERMEAFRIEARVRKLPRLYDEVAELARRVAKLEAATDHPEHG